MALYLVPFLVFMQCLSKVNSINKGLSSESYTSHQSFLPIGQKKTHADSHIFLLSWFKELACFQQSSIASKKGCFLISSCFPHLHPCLQLDDYSTLLGSSRCGFKSWQTEVRIRSSLPSPGKVH